MTTCTRHQDIDCGHRVVRQGGACERLHGHTYRIHFTCTADALNDIGMVIDFGVVKSLLCQWLLDHWDHRFLAWVQDPLISMLVDATTPFEDATKLLGSSIVWVEFNPTAENIAEYLLNIVGPRLLSGTGVRLVQVTVEETRKCLATAATHAD